MAEQIYKIGVELALVGGLEAGLALIAGKLTGLGKQVGDIESGFKRWGLLLGAGGIAGSIGIVEGLSKVIDKGGELVKQQALLSAAGASAAEVLADTHAAMLASQNVIGTTIDQNVKGLRELRSIMNNPEEARAIYPEALRVSKVIEAYTGKPAEDTMQKLVRATEQLGGGTDPVTGKIDPERFLKYLGVEERAIAASGGYVNADTILGFAKQAGPAARLVTDPNSLFDQFMTPMIEMGGPRAGTALTAMDRQLLGGKMTRQTALELQDLGILKAGQWAPAGGSGISMNPGAIVGEDIIKDPTKGIGDWMNSVFVPALKKANITAPADVMAELYRGFGTETARRFAALYIQNQAQVGRDINLLSQANQNAYAGIAAADLNANVTNFKDAITNLMETFGAPMVPIAISAIGSLSSGINSMASFANDHPDAMRRVGEGLVGLAGGLAVFGGVAMVAALAAFAGPTAIGYAGIAGLAAGLAVLGAINWSGVSTSISTAFTSIESQLVSAISGIPGALAGAIAGIPGAIGGALKNVFTGSGTNTGPAPNGFNSAPSTSGKGMGKQSSNGTPVNVKTAIYLDGRVIGQSTSSQFASNSQFPRQAAVGDSYSGWWAPDGNATA